MSARKKETLYKCWTISEVSDRENRMLSLCHGIWHLGLTLVADDNSCSIRKTFSLKTKDLEVAKKRRDRIINAIKLEKRFYA